MRCNTDRPHELARREEPRSPIELPRATYPTSMARAFVMAVLGRAGRPYPYRTTLVSSHHLSCFGVPAICCPCKVAGISSVSPSHERERSDRTTAGQPSDSSRSLAPPTLPRSQNLASLARRNHGLIRRDQPVNDAILDLTDGIAVGIIPTVKRASFCDAELPHRRRNKVGRKESSQRGAEHLAAGEGCATA